MPNFKRKIAAHNSRAKNIGTSPQPPPGCNCTGLMGPCPLEGNCLVKSVVYEAEVTRNNNISETYTGLTSNTFKKRYYNHRDSFKKQDSEHSIPFLPTFGTSKIKMKILKLSGGLKIGLQLLILSQESVIYA